MMYGLIVFLPLIGFLYAALLGRHQDPRRSEIVTTALLGVCALFSWIAFFGFAFSSDAEPVIVHVANWMTAGKLAVAWSLRIDALTTVMFVVVNTVSFLVHLYSIGYMHEDDSRPRFFAYLSLFTFAMLMRVTSVNLLQVIRRVPGIGSETILGSRTYAMRVWLKPDRMRAYKISTEDVMKALAEQSVIGSPGRLGQATG